MQVRTCVRWRGRFKSLILAQIQTGDDKNLTARLRSSSRRLALLLILSS